ncbi:hypothetical protein Y032_0047g1461 [Ancylostoma ceylanicum]|uniref:Uncharacterized protein n=1 Tax=Ancylostoma ceylanicum TaxID=53326 RepID=A0A016UC41_9BILA|nr:hypothetical protein Y032_0047g1461 [Ancylostoma ceylanicum]
MSFLKPYKNTIQESVLSCETLEKARNEFQFTSVRAEPTCHLLFDKPALPMEEIFESKMLFMLTRELPMHSNHRLFQFFLPHVLKIECACPKTFAAPCICNPY